MEFGDFMTLRSTFKLVSEQVSDFTSV